MKLSAKQAAKEVGKSTPTITRAIKSGLISANKNNNGGYEIEPAELFRVFPAIAINRSNVKGNDTPRITADETPNVTSALSLEIKYLHENLEEKEKRLVDKDAVIADLQKRLDDESIERRKLTMLLTDQRNKEEISPKKQDQILLWLLPLITALGILLTMIALKNI